MSLPKNKTEARRWIRLHWADLIRGSDMGAVGDLDCPHLEEVWDDECKKIAARMERSST